MNGTRRNRQQTQLNRVENAFQCMSFWMYVCVWITVWWTSIYTQQQENEKTNTKLGVYSMAVCVLVYVLPAIMSMYVCMCRCWWFVCFFSSSVSHFHWLLSFTYAWIAHAHTQTPSVPKLNWEPNQTKPMPLKKEFTIYRLVNKNIWAALSNGYTHIFWTHIVRKRQSIMPPTFDKHFYVYINEIMRYPTINHVITNQ